MFGTIAVSFLQDMITNIGGNIMAIRPVFTASASKPFVTKTEIEFSYFSGFSITQKQKSINSLHANFLTFNPGHKVLEISTKSTSPLGVSLSAFNLNIKTNLRSFSVENAFQSSKVFENGGPYIDLLDKPSREAKKDERLHSSGKLIAFKYFNHEFPLEPKDFFYNWLYINALHLNQELASEIENYDSFTDIEFNPQKSINCQAKAAAIFVGLKKQNLLPEAIESHKSFLRIVYGHTNFSNFNQLHLHL